MHCLQLKWRCEVKKRRLILGGLLSVLFVIIIGFLQLPKSVPLQPPSDTLGVLKRVSDNSNTQIIFIHGSPGEKNGYISYLNSPSLQAIADLVAIDRLGYGESNSKPEPSIRQQAIAILPLLSGKKFNILVGHSLGGPIALQVALMAPEKVHGMILVAPAFDPELEHPKWYNYFADTKIAKWILPNDWNQSNIEMMSLSKELQKLATQDWGVLTMPIRIVHGEEDNIADPGNSVFAIQRLPSNSSNLIWAKNEGHFILWQNIPVIVQHIEALVKEVQ